MTTVMYLLLFVPSGLVGLIGLIIWASENDTPEQAKQRNAIHREPLYDKHNLDKIHWI
jgi:hypothetical protein